MNDFPTFSGISNAKKPESRIKQAIVKSTPPIVQPKRSTKTDTPMAYKMPLPPHVTSIQRNSKPIKTNSDTFETILDVRPARRTTQETRNVEYADDNDNEDDNDHDNDNDNDRDFHYAARKVESDEAPMRSQKVPPPPPSLSTTSDTNITSQNTDTSNHSTNNNSVSPVASTDQNVSRAGCGGLFAILNEHKWTILGVLIVIGLIWFMSRKPADDKCNNKLGSSTTTTSASVEPRRSVLQPETPAPIPHHPKTHVPAPQPIPVSTPIPAPTPQPQPQSTSDAEQRGCIRGNDMFPIQQQQQQYAPVNQVPPPHMMYNTPPYGHMGPNPYVHNPYMPPLPPPPHAPSYQGHYYPHGYPR